MNQGEHNENTRIRKNLEVSAIINSRYWNMVHGATPDQVKQDLEGMQVMRILGKNMAWFLKCREAGEKAGIALPEQEVVSFTNFIRE